MKKILFILMSFVLVSGTLAQTKRVLVKGLITVPEGDSREGVTVYNVSSNQGTITGPQGQFTLAMGENDRVVFSALQYNDVIVLVDEGIVNNQVLRLELVENLTILDNVTVRPYDLSGNIRVDVGKVRTTTIEQFPEVTLAEIEFNNEIVADAQTSVTNVAMEGFNFQNGLNFINLFKVAFQKRDRYRIDQDAISPNVDVALRSMYDDAFFKEHMQLELDEISAFIFYAEEKGLNAELLRKGQELNLISFLMNTRRDFKANQD